MGADIPARLRIIVAGYLVRGPLGGMAANKLQYLMGLAALGHDVFYVEDSGDYPMCYDPLRDATDVDPAYGLHFAGRVLAGAGFGDRWAYYDAHTARWLGPAAGRILGVCSTADLLINLSGLVPLRPWLASIPARALIDTDPAFTQIGHLTDRLAREQASRHTVFLTYGENVGQATCSVPDDGMPWQPTRQPIFLDAWRVTPGPANGRYTTVMLWDSYPVREFNGVRFGMKSESFGPFLDLPTRARGIFEVALGSPTAPRARLRRNGWAVRDSRKPTIDVRTYQRYIRRSKAEFSVAKHGYAVSHTGWFSERSAAYLASGRPVLVQETGFSDWLESGAGVIPFTTPEGALAGIEELNARYEFHCRAAREVAEEYFDARKVLARLVERSIASAPAAASDRAAASRR